MSSTPFSSPAPGTDLASRRGSAVGRWIAAEGRVNAIADLRLLPDELRRRVEITKTFGSAAVIRRPETAADGKMGDCDLGR